LINSFGHKLRVSKTNVDSKTKQALAKLFFTPNILI
jgi:hypothetical protein